MRWKSYVEGDKRTRSGFLWFPKTIEGVTRWLERAEWEEQYIMTCLPLGYLYWYAQHWMD